MMSVRFGSTVAVHWTAKISRERTLRKGYETYHRGLLSHNSSPTEYMCFGGLNFTSQFENKIMPNFSIDSYQSALMEIRERLFSADILSKTESVVFIESTALQIRKILELISYLSILVNSEKLNHKEKNEWRAQKIIETLTGKTTIFYPLPSRVVAPQEKENEPTLIPLSTKCALSQADFVDTYNNCGKILHAQHPFKDVLDFRQYFVANRKSIDKIRNLLQNHVIAIRHDHNKYTFLSVEFDFTNNEDTRPTVIREYKSHIFDEMRLKNLFEKFWNI